MNGPLGNASTDTIRKKKTTHSIPAHTLSWKFASSLKYKKRVKLVCENYKDIFYRLVKVFTTIQLKRSMREIFPGNRRIGSFYLELNGGPATYLVQEAKNLVKMSHSIHCATTVQLLPTLQLCTDID